MASKHSPSRTLAIARDMCRAQQGDEPAATTTSSLSLGQRGIGTFLRAPLRFRNLPGLLGGDRGSTAAIAGSTYSGAQRPTQITEE